MYAFGDDVIISAEELKGLTSGRTARPSEGPR